MIKDYYKTLGIVPSASAEEVTASFRLLAKKLHPDVNKEPRASRRFCEVCEAYGMLRYPLRRAEYDRLYYQSRDAGRTVSATKGSDSDMRVHAWAKASAARAEEYSKMTYREFASIVLSNVSHAGRLGCMVYCFFGGALWLVGMGISVLAVNPLGLILVGLGVWVAIRGVKRVKEERLRHKFERGILSGGRLVCPQCGDDVRSHSPADHSYACATCGWAIRIE